MERRIKNFAISQFKYQNLLEMLFTTGAYCLFKKRYEYIKYLWEYKQPSDSTAIWIGHNITPETLGEIIKLYFHSETIRSKSYFWEGHHGSERYYKQYFALLLAHILKIPANAKYQTLRHANYRVSDLSINQLSDLERSIDELVILAKELKKSKSMFARIGFDTENLDEIFEGRLIPVLHSLKI